MNACFGERFRHKPLYVCLIASSEKRFLQVKMLGQRLYFFLMALDTYGQIAFPKGYKNYNPPTVYGCIISLPQGWYCNFSNRYLHFRKVSMGHEGSS